MEVDKFSVDIPCLSQFALMLEAYFFKAPPGRHIASLNDGVDSMQVISGKCQGGEMAGDRCSHSFIPIVGVAYDNAYFAAAMGRIKVFQGTVADEVLSAYTANNVFSARAKYCVYHSWTSSRVRIPCRK